MSLERQVNDMTGTGILLVVGIVVLVAAAIYSSVKARKENQSDPSDPTDQTP